MQAHREKTALSEDGIVTLHGVPFCRGECVEVIILPLQSPEPLDERYPLRGTPFTLVDPFEPVAEEDWEVLK